MDRAPVIDLTGLDDSESDVEVDTEVDAKVDTEVDAEVDAEVDPVVDAEVDPVVDVDAEDHQDAVSNAVLAVFPNMCPHHLHILGLQHDWHADNIVSAVLDQVAIGEMYPTRPQDNPLKRKREDSDNEEDEEELEEPRVVTETRARVTRPGYWDVDMETGRKYRVMTKLLLSQDFCHTPIPTIMGHYNTQGTLFTAYESMYEAVRNVEDWRGPDAPWKLKKSASKVVHDLLPNNIDNLGPDKYTHPGERRALEEFRAARMMRAHREAKEAEFARAQQAGETAECGCCYEEKVTNRMARCNVDPTHLFCAECMRRHAETQVGYAKHELSCMSMDGCQGGFSFAQKRRFLNRNLRDALDDIEQEAVLREAAIETLETCPFCPYAADYPPPEAEKEFLPEAVPYSEELRRVCCRGGTDRAAGD